jgi:hypothetical protein
MLTSISTLSTYISGHPDRAIGFLIDTIHVGCNSDSRAAVHRLVQTFLQVPPQTRIPAVDRLIRWCLGYQTTADGLPQSRWYGSSHTDVFTGFEHLPELTPKRIRDAIAAELSSPSPASDCYDFLVFLYRHNPCHITTVFPELFQALKDDIALLRDRIADGTLEKRAFVPLVCAGDRATPRCVKFGGCVPHDPSASPLCPSCSVALAHVVSIYVPLLPQPIQDFFPPDERETLIVVCYCEHCFLNPPTFVYRGAEIDRLVMSPDHVMFRRPFNEPRVVVGWQEALSHAHACGMSGLGIIGTKYRSDSVWTDVIEPTLNDSTGNTYFGGFPEFVQSDEQPTPSSVLLLQMAQSRASTALWGDCGTAQVWIETGRNYGKVQVTWACS